LRTSRTIGEYVLRRHVVPVFGQRRERLLDPDARPDLAAVDALCFGIRPSRTSWSNTDGETPMNSTASSLERPSRKCGGIMVRFDMSYFSFRWTS